MMHRRSFLAAGGAGALAALTGLRLFVSSPQEVVVAVLSKRLGYLKLDRPGLQRFADDVVAHGVISPLRLRTLGAFMPFYQSLALTGREGWVGSVRHGEERIITAYLMSSDFFLHEARCDRVVHYLGYYDPLRSLAACGNPFARKVILPENDTPAAVPWPAAATAPGSAVLQTSAPGAGSQAERLESSPPATASRP